MKEVVYKPNRVLIVLLIDGLVIPVIMITLLVLFNITTILLELTESLIIIVSAHLVYKDAQRIRAGASDKQGLFEPDTWSPTSWGLVVLFFWIIMLPLYLLMREGIFWKNQQPYLDEGKPIRHYVEPPKHRSPASKPVIYGENVLFCPNCETPYSIKMLERSPYCKHCGEILKKE
jgi:hypothetical protein